MVGDYPLACGSWFQFVGAIKFVLYSNKASFNELVCDLRHWEPLQQFADLGLEILSKIVDENGRTARLEYCVQRYDGLYFGRFGQIGDH